MCRSAFLNCSNINSNFSNGGCIYFNQGQCISYRICSTKSISLNAGSYCVAAVSDSSSKNYIFLSSIHPGSSTYTSFSFQKGDASVSFVNDTDNIAQGNPAFFTYQCQNFYINYSYFKGNKATNETQVIFSYFQVSLSEIYSSIFLNNSHVDAGWGIFGFYNFGIYNFRECIIKYNEHKYLIHVDIPSISISIIKCLIEENTYLYNLLGSAETHIETTNSLSIELRIFF